MVKPERLMANVCSLTSKSSDKEGECVSYVLVNTPMDKSTLDFKF